MLSVVRLSVLFVAAFAELRKETLSFIVFRLSVRMQQLGFTLEGF
jgi:hypothetical protein